MLVHPAVDRMIWLWFRPMAKGGMTFQISWRLQGYCPLCCHRGEGVQAWSPLPLDSICTSWEALLARKIMKCTASRWRLRPGTAQGAQHIPLEAVACLSGQGPCNSLPMVLVHAAWAFPDGGTLPTQLVSSNRTACLWQR